MLRDRFQWGVRKKGSVTEIRVDGNHLSEEKKNGTN